MQNVFLEHIVMVITVVPKYLNIMNFDNRFPNIKSQKLYFSGFCLVIFYVEIYNQHSHLIFISSFPLVQFILGVAANIFLI